MPPRHAPPRLGMPIHNSHGKSTPSQLKRHKKTHHATPNNYNIENHNVKITDTYLYMPKFPSK